MKILYIITKSNWGGAQRHVFDLATAMKEKGHDVWVALGGNGLLKEKLGAANIYTFSISGLSRDISVGKDAGSFKEMLSIIKSKRPDIIHLHSTKAMAMGSIAGRLLGVKQIISTVHGWAFNEPRPWYERLGIIIASWLTMVFSHTTILLSEREYAQAARFPFVKDKIKLIPPGLNPTTFMSVEGAKQSISKAIGMSVAEFGKRTTIVTIAELHPNKGLTYLIEAMRTIKEQLPQAICIIIGQGGDMDMLKSLIASYGLEQTVFLAGYLDNAAEYLKAFNIFVLPSVKEGLPYALLEAGSAALPAVATSVGGIPEMIDDMKSGILVQSKNSRELGHALSFMIEHPEERKKYGLALKEKVATKYALDKMIWLVEGVYTTAAR